MWLEDLVMVVEGLMQEQAQLLPVERLLIPDVVELGDNGSMWEDEIYSLWGTTKREDEIIQNQNQNQIKL